MTSAGIELATFRFVAQHLNHCATAVPDSQLVKLKIIFNVYRGKKNTTPPRLDITDLHLHSHLEVLVYF